MTTTTLRAMLMACLLPAIHAQAQLTFQKSIGGSGDDFATVIIATADGGYAMAGTTGSYGAGGDDMWLIKLDSNGDTLWTRTYGGSDDEYGNCVAQTADGGYLFMGDSSSFGALGQDIYMVKTDANGAPQWSKLFGAPGTDYAGMAYQSTDGGYLLLGSSTGLGAGVSDAYVIKLDGGGNVAWTKTYGGTLDDDGNSIRPTSDGGFILVGTTSSFGAGGYDAFVVKASADGAITWSKVYGGAGDEYGFSIEQLADGGYCVSGTATSGGAGGFDCLLMRLDASGAVVWAKTYGSTDTDISGSALATTDGGYILLGQSFGFGVASDLYLVKTDANGDTLWTSIYGGNGYEFESIILQTQDGGYLFSAGEESFGPDRNAYLIKTDASGNSGCDQGSTATQYGPITLVTANAAMTVSSGGTTTTAATITSSGGSVNTICTTAGIAEPGSTAMINVHPLPFSSLFTLSGTQENGTIVIMDITGKIRCMQRATEGITEVDARGLAAGSYLLKYQKGEESTVIKLVKE